MNKAKNISIAALFLLASAPGVTRAAPLPGTGTSGSGDSGAAASPPAPATPPSAASGQEADREAARARATQLFREGNQALDSGDYRGALAKFEEAYRQYPSPKLLFNMAQAYNELGRLVEAIEHYERFVKEFPKAESPELFALAHKRIFALQGQIVSLRLEINVVGAQVTVDGRPVGESPIAASVRVLPGPHAVVVAKAGYERQIVQRDLKAGSTVLRIELLTEAEAVAKRKEVRRLAEQRRLAEERLRKEQEESRRNRLLRLERLRISGWAVLGTGIAMLAVGSGFGINSIVKTRYVESRPDGTDWSDVAADYRAAELSRLGFWVGVGLGAAVAAAGAVMLYVHARQARQEEALPSAAPPAAVAGTTSLRLLPLAGPGGLGASLSFEY